MPEFFEAMMVICFGISWPLSIAKTYKSRSTKGKSLLFECFIWIGYLFGIVSKLVSDNITYVFVFYCINLVSVSIDLCLYMRNRRLERSV